MMDISTGINRRVSRLLPGNNAVRLSMARSIHHQEGIALITVMMILVLFSILAIYETESQDLALRRVENIRSLDRSYQVSAGGEQWAIQVIQKDDFDDEQNGRNMDHPGESWGNLGAAVQVEGTDSFLQVTIRDQQGLFNLNNLRQGRPKPGDDESQQQGDEQSGDSPADDEGQENADEDGNEVIEVSENSGDNGPKAPTWYEIFQLMLINLELEPTMADVLVDWIDRDGTTSGTSGAEDDYYSGQDGGYLAANQPLSSIAELRALRGFGEEQILRLAPHVTALPAVVETEYSLINVNTASEVLLAALAAEPGAAADQFFNLVEQRRSSPFEDVSQFVQAYSSSTPYTLRPGIQSLLGVSSQHYSSISCGETGRARLSHEALLRLDESSGRVVVMRRQSHYGCPAFSPEANSDEPQG